MAGPPIEIRITELAPGGAGVGHADHGGARRAVFVERAAVGDLALVDVDFASRPARGALVAVREPGPGRVASPCAHADRCGGCDWMHLAPDAQAAAHRAIVLGAVPPELAAGADVELFAAPARTGARARARLHLVARDRRITMGMFAPRSHDPVPVPDCPILDPALERARLALGALFAEAFAREGKGRGRGEARLALGPIPEPAAQAPRRAVLDLAWEGELPPGAFAALERAIGAGGFLAGARVRLAGAKRPLDVGDPTPWILAADGAPLRLAPGGFAQSSDDANARLARSVASLAAPRADDPPSPLVELYAGAGNLTVLLAARAKVTACESDEDAAAAARANLAARGLSAKVATKDARAFEIPEGTRVVVLDPPRAGAREVCERLAKRPVARVVYVSCDAQTLGRDLAVLAPRYDLARLELHEMFPQTSHVEVVALLERKKRG